MVKKEIHCRHYMSYFFQLAARFCLYAPSHREDNTYHNLCYTSHEALAWTTKKAQQDHDTMSRLSTTEIYVAPTYQ